MLPMPLEQPMLVPEVVASRDEQQPVIGPNLASDEALCKAVTKFLVTEYWLGYWYMQQDFITLWRQLDEMWRAKVQCIDLDIPVKNYNQTTMDGLVAPNPRDGFTLKVSPTDMHRGWDALLKTGLQISFDGGGLPVGAVKPNYVFESLYAPTQNTVDAANEIISDTAHNTNLRMEWKKNFHSFVVYGVAWALKDLKRTFIDVDVRYNLGIDMAQVQMGLMQLAQRYPGQEPQIEQGPTGVTAVFRERRVKELYTTFKHLNKDDVFTNLLMDCSDMDTHPCPWIRQHIGEFALEQNQYDPETNAFGWLNIEKARVEGSGQYVLSQEDETTLVQQLMHRYNLSDQGIIKPERTIKQLWTAYPMLRIGPNGELDEGKGIPCPVCAGQIEGECPACKGSKRVYVPAKRYVAQFYGNPRQTGMTCLRLQEMPEGMGVPIQYAADQIQDTSCAIPACKGEVAMNDFYIKAECDNLWLQSKRWAALRGFKKKVDSPCNDVNPLKPGQDVPFDNNPDECVRLEANQIDETVTMAPYIADRSQRIKEVLGTTDEFLGQIGRTHISATQIANSIDATRNPIIIMIDGYNTQMMGGWAKTLVKNLDLFGDRDWIRKKTGKEFFGDLRFNTNVAEEYIKKMTRAANQNRMLELIPQMIPVMPQLQPVLTDIMQKWLVENGMGDVVIPDNGLLEAQQEAMQLVSKILGDGMLIPPLPDDPDEIYIRVFTSALRKIAMGNDYWSGKCDQTLPLLQQRLQMQTMQRDAKMQQQLLMQMQMNAAMNPQPEGDGKAPPKKGSEAAPTAGGQIQDAQGGFGGMAA